MGRSLLNVVHLLWVVRRSDHNANRPSIEPLAAKACQNSHAKQHRVQETSSAKQRTVTPLANYLLKIKGTYNVLKPAVPYWKCTLGGFG